MGHHRVPDVDVRKGGVVGIVPCLRTMWGVVAEGVKGKVTGKEKVQPKEEKDVQVAHHDLAVVTVVVNCHKDCVNLLGVVVEVKVAVIPVGPRKIVLLQHHNCVHLQEHKVLPAVAMVCVCQRESAVAIRGTVEWIAKMFPTVLPTPFVHPVCIRLHFRLVYVH